MTGPSAHRPGDHRAHGVPGAGRRWARTANGLARSPGLEGRPHRPGGGGGTGASRRGCRGSRPRPPSTSRPWPRCHRRRASDTARRPAAAGSSTRAPGSERGASRAVGQVGPVGEPLGHHPEPGPAGRGHHHRPGLGHQRPAADLPDGVDHRGRHRRVHPHLVVEGTVGLDEGDRRPLPPLPPRRAPPTVPRCRRPGSPAGRRRPAGRTLPGRGRRRGPRWPPPVPRRPPPSARIRSGPPAWKPQARLALVTDVQDREVAPGECLALGQIGVEIHDQHGPSIEHRDAVRGGPRRPTAGSVPSPVPGQARSPLLPERHDLGPQRRYRLDHAATARTHARTAPGRTGQGRQGPPRAGRGEREAQTRIDHAVRALDHGRLQRDRREDEGPLGPRVACRVSGKVKARRLMDTVGISESRRLQGLGSNQRESLLRETAR